MHKFHKIPRLALFAVLTIASVQTWQASSAQAPLEVVEPHAQEPSLLPVPSTGYQPPPKTAESEEGRELFQQLNCMACHSVKNVGGDLAPRLDGVGGRRSDQFLMAHLSKSPADIEAYRRIRGQDTANSLPHSRYMPENARLLVDYIKTLPEPPGGFVVMPHVPRLPAERSPIKNADFRPLAKSAESEEGKKLYDKFGCVACHAIGDFGGALGPRLDGVGARRDRDYIYAHITDAQAHAVQGAEIFTSRSNMPRFQLGAKETKELTDYLLTLPDLK